MKLTTIILGLLILLTIQSCELKNSKKSDVLVENSKDIFDKYSNDSIRNEIFKIAYQNTSTAPSYIVFKAVDLNTGKTKEICCEAPFLSGAMEREFAQDYDAKGSEFIDSLILQNTNKVFKFKNKEALKNIGFEQYPDSARIREVALKNNLEYFVAKYGANDSIASIDFSEYKDKFAQLVFAHIMFECGIVTSRDCIAGNYLWFGDPNKAYPEVKQADENKND